MKEATSSRCVNQRRARRVICTCAWGCYLETTREDAHAAQTVALTVTTPSLPSPVLKPTLSLRPILVRFQLSQVNKAVAQFLVKEELKEQIYLPVFKLFSFNHD